MYYESISDLDMIQLINPVVDGIQQIARIKITNYITIANLYVEQDFIMHLRLSRAKTYEIVDRFEASPIYQVHECRNIQSLN